MKLMKINLQMNKKMNNKMSLIMIRNKIVLVIKIAFKIKLRTHPSIV